MKRKRRYFYPWPLAGLGVVLLLGLVVWLIRTAHPPSLISSGQFSIPPSSKAEDFAQWMDLRLREFWTAMGVPAAHLQRVDLSMHDWEGERWGMRALEIRLPAEISPAQAATALEGFTRKGTYAVQVVWVIQEDGFRAADLWVEGFLTHRIFLRAALDKSLALPPIPARPQLVLIVDDLGNFYRPIRPLLEIEAPLTLAVFPLRPYSRQIAEEAQRRGMEVILHLPMEPHDYPEKKPGPGALLVTMDDQELERVLVADLSDLPQVRGVNNHMGSRFTEDPTRMARVMEILAARGLYFVDSLTTARSVGFQLAREWGIQAYRRDVFLDVFEGEERIRAQFKKLLRVASLQGYAIGICHPYPDTLRLLPELISEAQQRGFRLATVSQLRIPGVKPLAAKEPRTNPR